MTVVLNRVTTSSHQVIIHPILFPFTGDGWWAWCQGCTSWYCGARHHRGGGRCRHVDPPMQVSVSETGRISTDFAFDNPQYSLSDRDALRDSTLTKIRSPSAKSGEGDILSRIIEDVSTEMSTSTGSFVFGKKNSRQ